METIDSLISSLEELEKEKWDLIKCINNLLLSADCTWEKKKQGHDWDIAVSEARKLLQKFLDTK